MPGGGFALPGLKKGKTCWGDWDPPPHKLTNRKKNRSFFCLGGGGFGFPGLPNAHRLWG